MYAFIYLIIPSKPPHLGVGGIWLEPEKKVRWSEYTVSKYRLQNKLSLTDFSTLRFLLLKHYIVIRKHYTNST